MKEGDPGSVHPDDLRDTPDKNVSEIEKLRAKESESGHYSSQKPDTENLDQQDFQIDAGTKKILNNNDDKNI